MRTFFYDVISKMAAMNLAKLEVILKITMKHGMFGIKLDGMKHRIRNDVAKLESIRIGSKVNVLEGQGHFKDDHHFT